MATKKTETAQEAQEAQEVQEVQETVQAAEPEKPETADILLPVDESMGNDQTVEFCINGRKFTVERGVKTTLPKYQADFITDEWMPAMAESLKTRSAAAARTPKDL